MTIVSILGGIPVVPGKPLHTTEDTIVPINSDATLATLTSLRGKAENENKVQKSACLMVILID